MCKGLTIKMLSVAVMLVVIHGSAFGDVLLLDDFEDGDYTSGPAVWGQTADRNGGGAGAPAFSVIVDPTDAGNMVLSQYSGQTFFGGWLATTLPVFDTNENWTLSFRLALGSTPLGRGSWMYAFLGTSTNDPDFGVKGFLIHDGPYGPSGDKFQHATANANGASFGAGWIDQVSLDWFDVEFAHDSTSGNTTFTYSGTVGGSPKSSSGVYGVPDVFTTFSVGGKTGPPRPPTYMDDFKFEGTAIPAPATWVLLAIGGIGVLMRRGRQLLRDRDLRS